MAGSCGHCGEFVAEPTPNTRLIARRMWMRLMKVRVVNYLVAMLLAIVSLIVAPLAFQGVRRRADFQGVLSNTYCDARHGVLRESLYKKYSTECKSSLGDITGRYMVSLFLGALTVAFSEKLSALSPFVGQHRWVLLVIALLLLSAAAIPTFEYWENSDRSEGFIFIVPILLIPLAISFSRFLSGWFPLMGEPGWIVAVEALFLACVAIIPALRHRMFGDLMASRIAYLILIGLAPILILYSGTIRERSEALGWVLGILAAFLAWTGCLTVMEGRGGAGSFENITEFSLGMALAIAFMAAFPGDLRHWFRFLGAFGWALVAIALILAIILACSAIIEALKDVYRLTRVRVPAELAYVRNKQYCPVCGAALRTTTVAAVRRPLFGPNVTEPRSRNDIAGLIRALESRKPLVVEEAERTLEEMGAGAVDPLLSAFSGDHPDDRLRAKIARVLGHIGDQRAVRPLAKKLDFCSLIECAPSNRENLESSKLRPLSAAIEDALTRIGGKSAVEALESRCEALSGAIKSAMWAGATTDSLQLLSRALQKVEKALDKIRPRIEEEQEQARDARYYEDLLSSPVPGRIDEVIAALKCQDREIVKKAAEVLGQMKDLRAVQPLVDLLKESFGSVRSSAAEALGALGAKDAVMPLLEVMANEPERGPLRASAKALGDIGHRMALTHLEAWIDNYGHEVRPVVAEAIRKIREKNPS